MHPNHTLVEDGIYRTVLLIPTQEMGVGLKHKPHSSEISSTDFSLQKRLKYFHSLGLGVSQG
jgi:hypothetical protein